MKRITLTDITLFERGGTLTFKEKVEIAKVLDRLGTDTIRLPAIRDIKPDTMATRTVAAVVANSTLSLPVGYTASSVDEAWNAVCTAKKPELPEVLYAMHEEQLQVRYLQPSDSGIAERKFSAASSLKRRKQKSCQLSGARMPREWL